MELMACVSELMPQGNPKFLDVIKYDKLEALKGKLGFGVTHKLVFLMVKDFCASLNVVRNMNDDQMIEAAGMLLDECDNFRLEDYVMMFSLAKRGGLVKIYDRIDLETISGLFDAYWIKRNNAAIEAQETVVIGQETQFKLDRVTQFDEYDKMGSLGSAIADMKNKLRDV